jgi:uncharacterized protein
MHKQVEIKIHPDKVLDHEYIEKSAFQKAGIKFATEELKAVIVKKSIDARGKEPSFIIKVDILPKSVKTAHIPHHHKYQSVSTAKRVVILGAGPAGYWAGLELIELGLKPIILDRGKDVRARRRDLRAIQQFGEVNPHSNYCFGEGGAGTYSDGKLYTRSNKRGSIQKVLEQFVDHGALEEILIDAHPHIGSNKLPNIIAKMRETIVDFGGEVHFETYITDLELSFGKIKSLKSEDGRQFDGEAFIFATGHSARDIYQLLHHKNILIEAKPFALGVRIEHAQNYIDQLQYHQLSRHDNLPAASYKAVCQVGDKGVFSFCMCPGGLIVPASTSPGELVVNGMSLSRRDSPYANSGYVTSIELDELASYGFKGLFASMDFQADVEQSIFKAGNGTQAAPAQRVGDFVNSITSSSLPETSYIPGILSRPMQEILPKFVSKRLQQGIIEINKKMKGYHTNDAIIVGVESRTSSPLRIPRDHSSLMHPQIEGLFPCGEGAGYAGGILSAAMDGQNVAQAISKYLNNRNETNYT